MLKAVLLVHTHALVTVAMALSFHKYNQKERENRPKNQEAKKEEMENKAENWENGSKKKIDADVMKGQILRLQTQTGGNER